MARNSVGGSLRSSPCFLPSFRRSGATTRVLDDKSLLGEHRDRLTYASATCSSPHRRPFRNALPCCGPGIDYPQAAGDIHPRNKQDVGHRLALAAMAVAFGKEVSFSGPLYKGMTLEGNQVRVHFAHAGVGMKAKDGGALRGFAVAGKDRKFVWANARIEGKTIVVSSPSVSQPVAVRYAWADNPECNLYGGTDLPASPFRTDNWPGLYFSEDGIE